MGPPYRDSRLDGAFPTCFDPPDDLTNSAILPPESAEKPALERVGAYELVAELASGGMATVYLGRATDKREGPPLVAVKRPHKHLATDKGFLTMLVDEARLASAIRHENVVRVRELGFEGGIPFIVMDYVEGASLAELRKELAAAGRAMDVRVGVRIILDALAGLQSAHELRDETGRHLGIIHRDVSPHNVLIGCDGRAFITDFGIAKAEDRVQVTRTHEVKGKLAYLAPERIDKRRICTVQSDVFSMAVVLWECFAGRRLFRGEDAVETLQEVMTAPIPLLKQIGAQVPPALDDVIARALSRDLETRYESCADLAEAVERAVGKENVGTHADVARLMEALFGSRMAERHQNVRGVLGSGALDALLAQSGLPPRPSMATLPPDSSIISELAPPAPSGRYAVGEIAAPTEKVRPRRAKWWLLGGVAAGLVVGVVVTAAVASRRSTPPPIVVARTQATAPPRIDVVVPPPAASTRKVVVPLPFLATHVAFDDAARDLDPAADVISFDVSVEAGQRHLVTALGIDGTRAEAYVHEQDGIARPDALGYTMTLPSAAPVEITPAPTARGGGGVAPIGTVKNGFTKLR
jgi:serine/threonine-protein kinase